MTTSDDTSVPLGKPKYTPLSSIAPLIDEARGTYASGITRSYEFRMKQLRGIERLIQENSASLSTAIAEDFGQGPMFAEAFELTHVISHSRHAQSNLKSWMSTQRKPTPFPLNLNIPVHSELAPNPRGLALIMTPWNLPLNLNLNPLIYALSAGNVVILKLSERCVHCTELLTKLLTSGKYVDERVVRVVNGGAEEATELLKHRFDAIMYTGGGHVGRIVAAAAARHLTPVLLELGGKNPCFVTKNAHIPSAAMRIAWGKISGNAGQMCICPDYVLVEECVKEEFTAELCSAMDQMYHASSYLNHEDRGDVGKMISIEHAERVVSLIDSTCELIYGSTCDVVYGGEHNVKERFVAPTIVEANYDSTIMKQEIFGPVLAIVTVPNLDGAIQFVDRHYTSKGEHPLALYIFSRSKAEQRQIMEAIPSGTCAINEVLKQSANYNMPFGGVGSSGMGAYYGKFGFDFFSHYRGTLVGRNYSTWRFDPSVWVAYPPYDEKKLFVFRCVGKVPLLFDKLKCVVPFAKVVIPLSLAMACVLNDTALEALLELNLKTILKWISQAWQQ